MRLHLEPLEDRTLPSASSLPVVTVASPPAAPQVAAITSFVDSMVQQQFQVIDTIVQDASNLWNTLGQEIVQEVAAFEQRVAAFLGIDPDSSNPSQGTAVAQHSGSAITGHNAPNPSTTDAMPASASAGDG
jgi:hypothetical protein